MFLMSGGGGYLHSPEESGLFPEIVDPKKIGGPYFLG